MLFGRPLGNMNFKASSTDQLVHLLLRLKYAACVDGHEFRQPKIDGLRDLKNSVQFSFLRFLIFLVGNIGLLTKASKISVRLKLKNS